MVIILVHWLIKPDFEERFTKFWETMKVDPSTGLYQEILTAPDNDVKDSKFHTFSLENPNYKTYINIGIWNSLNDFDAAIRNYIPVPKLVNGKQVVEMEEFEFKIRERIVLKEIKVRKGTLKF